MISVQEVVVDPDMTAPHPYTILRSTGNFVPGGFDSVVTPIGMFGPVQQASNKEIQMLKEADRVGSIRSFWSTQPIYVTRGYGPVPGVHQEPLAVDGTTYTLSSVPPGESLTVIVDGLLMQPYVDYTIVGAVLTLRAVPDTSLYVSWQVTANVAASASDEIQYDEEMYRVLQVYFDPGGGYHKALASRMDAA